MVKTPERDKQTPEKDGIEEETDIQEQAAKEKDIIDLSDIQSDKQDMPGKETQEKDDEDEYRPTPPEEQEQDSRNNTHEKENREREREGRRRNEINRIGIFRAHRRHHRRKKSRRNREIQKWGPRERSRKIGKTGDRRKR